MAVQFAANVEDLAAFEHLPDYPGTISVFTDHPHHQPAMCRTVSGGVVLAMLAPISVAVPIQKSNQLVVDLVQEAPHPIHPERLKSFDPRAADQRPAAAQVWFEPVQATHGDLLVDVPVLREGDRPADPLVVGLVPYTPVPIAHDFATPAFDTS